MPPILSSLIDRVGGVRRALILGVGLAASAAVLLLAKWASAPTWVSAFGAVPLEQVGVIADKLTQAGIPNQLDRGGGQILVASTDVARARVLLARDGSLPGKGRPGFELFDQPSWGQTDLTQRVNYRRAMEGELERTLGAMRGVAAAKVHLVLHEAESYGAAAPPAEASVVLSLKGDDAPAADVIKGIALTVASSVEGLTSDHVTIVDDAGRPLNEADEPSSPTALSNRQLALQREVETYLREKTERLLAPVLGPRNARVQIAATLNFDRIERTSQSVDPEKQALATEQKAEIVPGTEGGAGSTNTSAAYVNTTQSESVSSAVGSVKRLTVAVLLAAPAPATGAGGGADSASARAIDPTPLTGQIEALVKNAVGYDATRGDQVSVIALPFAPPAPVPAAPARSTLETLQSVQRPALGAIGVLLAFGLGLVAVRAAARGATLPSPTIAALAVADGAAAGALPGAVAPEAGMMAPARSTPRVAPVIEIPNNPMVTRAAATVEQQPEVAAKLMRTWLREG